ncbi:MAG: RluA family pseudouridine synthase [Desulfovibrio sp.]|nr:RluA family pseudouridine synthase [Desulfovibrio sp.]
MSELETAADPGPAGGSPFPPVGRAESGQKLLQFLQRRLNLPPALLHRWVRTGQIRLNGRRAKPFARVSEGDMVRLPPFAGALAAQAGAPLTDGRAAKPPQAGTATPDAPPLPPLVGTLSDIWAFHKPAGLATHPGTGHEDSLSTRLAAHAPGAAFPPTPAHRLDKDTSGILLAAATHAALRQLQQAFRERRMVKEYVAWVAGKWPYTAPRLLRARVRKEGAPGAERMRVCDPGGTAPPDAREALCVARPLVAGDAASLLQIRLITGRTHQIRVQLAALGHPVLGDGKYGRGRRDGCPGLCLHALRVVLPDGRALECLPDWAPPYALDALPAPMPREAVEAAPACISPIPAAGAEPGAPH